MRVPSENKEQENELETSSRDTNTLYSLFTRWLNDTSDNTFFATSGFFYMLYKTVKQVIQSSRLRGYLNGFCY
jgi:hypothetical protein